MPWFYRDNDVEISQTSENFVVKFVSNEVFVDVPKCDIQEFMGSSINHGLIKGYALCLIKNNLL